MAPLLYAQSGFLDRLRERADEIADSAESVGQDVETVINADEIAADRVENAGRQAEREAESDLRDTVEATAPVSAAQSAGRDVRAAEAEADRIASTDERAAVEVQGRVGQAERALDVESRAEAEVAASSPVVATREAERELGDAQRTAAGIGQADVVSEVQAEAEAEAEAEARSRVDPPAEVEEAGNALDRARRALRDLR